MHPCRTPLPIGNVSVVDPFHLITAVLVRAKWHLTMFFYIYKVFWSFLYDFDLLNPNPLSASRKSLRNFVQAQKIKMAAKT